MAGRSAPAGAAHPELVVVPKSKADRPDGEKKAREKLQLAVQRGEKTSKIRKLCANVLAWGIRSYAIDGAQLAAAVRELCDSLGTADAEDSDVPSAGSFEAFVARTMAREISTVEDKSAVNQPEQTMDVDVPEQRNANNASILYADLHVENPKPMGNPDRPRKGVVDVAKIEALGRLGTPAKTIAEMLHMHPTTVQRYLKGMGLSKPRGRPKPSEYELRRKA